MKLDRGYWECPVDGEVKDLRETAKSYYVQLVAMAAPADTQHPELAQAQTFLGSK